MGEDELGTPPLDELPPVPGELECAVCGVHFEHSGRGRKPKTCPEHRGKKSSRATSSATPAEQAPKRPRGIESLQKTIHQQLVVLGAFVAFFDVFDSQVIMTKAEKGAKAVAGLAQTNPKIRHILESGVEAAGWLPVIVWGAEMALPILAHHGMIRGVPDPAQTQTEAAG